MSHWGPTCHTGVRTTHRSPRSQDGRFGNHAGIIDNTGIIGGMLGLLFGFVQPPSQHEPPKRFLLLIKAFDCGCIRQAGVQSNGGKDTTVGSRIEKLLLDDLNRGVSHCLHRLTSFVVNRFLLVLVMEKSMVFKVLCASLDIGIADELAAPRQRPGS